MKYLMWSKDRLAETVALWNRNLGKQYPIVGFIVSKTWQENREDVVLGEGLDGFKPF
jgi:hypothetical protein